MRFYAPLCGIALLLLALPAFGDGRWTIDGPDGGDVKRLVFDQSDPSIVYAAASNGLFRSADGGRHWLGAAALLGTTVLDVAVARSDSRIVFAASPYGLYKSADRGLNWSVLQSSGAFSLAVSAQNPDVIYDVSIAGVVRSTDGGVTFGNRGSGLPSGNPTAVAVDPQNASVAYAAFPSAAGVYKSTDGGAHWVQMNSGLTTSQVFSLTVDPSDAATLYAGGGASTIFKSTDGATSWTALTTGYSDLTCSGLTVNPSSPSTILAATNRGALISHDGGASWSRAGFLDASTAAVAIDPVDPSIFLAALSDHIYRTADGGATSDLSESGLTSFITQGIAVDPHDSGVIYATGPGGLARSADHGRTWSLSTSLKPVNVAVDTNGSTLYAVSGTVYRSVDGGNSWDTFGTGLPAGVPPSFLAADPQLSGALYAIVNGAVYKKAGADPWIKRSTGLADSMDFVTVDPHVSSTVYAGGPAGVFKSSNGGMSWAAANFGLTGLNTIGLSVDPFDSHHLFAWSPTQVFESADSAATWSLRPGVHGELHFDPATTGLVLASTFSDVQRSGDGGKTWFPLANGLPKSHALFAVGAGGTLYLGGSSGGVFVFRSGGIRRRAVSR